MSGLQDIRDALADVEHAIIEYELEVEAAGGATEADVLFDAREAEIERLRRENLSLRDTIRRQADKIARLERRSGASGRAQ